MWHYEIRDLQPDRAAQSREQNQQLLAARSHSRLRSLHPFDDCGSTSQKSAMTLKAKVFLRFFHSRIHHSALASKMSWRQRASAHQVHQKRNISRGLLRNPTAVLGQRGPRLTSSRSRKLHQLDVCLSFATVVDSVELQNTADSWTRLLQPQAIIQAPRHELVVQTLQSVERNVL